MRSPTSSFQTRRRADERENESTRAEPDAGGPGALRLDLQLEVVHEDVDHPLPQQDRPLPGEAREVTDLQLFPRLSGWVRLPSGV